MNKKLREYACKVEKILNEELLKKKITFTEAHVRIYAMRTVGVQGDERSYAHPVEIEVIRRNEYVWDDIFLENLSNRITNEVKEVNRVLYRIA